MENKTADFERLQLPLFEQTFHDADTMLFV